MRNRTLRRFRPGHSAARHSLRVSGGAKMSGPRPIARDIIGDLADSAVDRRTVLVESGVIIAHGFNVAKLVSCEFTAYV